MKSVAVIPIKSNSSRIPNKNFRDFHGNPLYKHFLKKLAPNNPFDEVYVDTDSDEVKEYADSQGFGVIDRPEFLTKDDANGNDLLVYEAKQVDADLYFQLFVTAPLLQPETISEAHSRLEANNDLDSVFTIESHHSFFWDEQGAINYDPSELPRTQDLDPIYEETTALYGIERDVLLDEECRIGHSPGFIEVGKFEAIDVDEKEDLEMARLVYERGLV